MASDRPWFLRPIEISDTAICDVDIGAGDVSVAGTAGVFACVLHYAKHLENELNTDVGAGFTVSVTGDPPKIQISYSGIVFDLAWTSTDIRDALGYTGDLSSSNSYTATNQPQYQWFPDRALRTPDYFHPLDDFAGTIAADGSLAGIATGPTLYRRKFDFDAIEAVKTTSELATSAAEMNRTFEAFWHGCRTTAPSDPSYANPKGFWYFPDYTDAAVAGDTSWRSANSGVQLSLTGGDDRVFCSPVVEKWERAESVLPRNRSYWRIEFEAVSVATVPNWASA